MVGRIRIFPLPTTRFPLEVISVKRIGFRGRLFLILLSFALVPAIILTLAWATTSFWILPRLSATAAWDSTAATGSRAIAVARTHKLSPADSAAIVDHEQTLRVSLLRSKQASFYFRQMAIAFAVAAVLAFGILLLVSSRVAGHLSRNLSRPLQEIVGW